jgi:hypothetical protein
MTHKSLLQIKRVPIIEAAHVLKIQQWVDENSRQSCVVNDRPGCAGWYLIDNEGALR